MSYHFDTVLTQNVKYGKETEVKLMCFSNSRDSSYTLQLKMSGNHGKATLHDQSKKIFLRFEADSAYGKVSDLNKLSHCTLFKSVTMHQNNNKNSVTDMQSEKDSITAQTIVHLTRFKNKKRKTIVGEWYYFIGKTNHVYWPKEKNYLLQNHFVFGTDENIERMLVLTDGKIDTDARPTTIETINFDFNFKIDDTYPKYNWIAPSVQQD